MTKQQIENPTGIESITSPDVRTAGAGKGVGAVLGGMAAIALVAVATGIVSTDQIKKITNYPFFVKSANPDEGKTKEEKDKQAGEANKVIEAGAIRSNGNQKDGTWLLNISGAAAPPLTASSGVSLSNAEAKTASNDSSMVTQKTGMYPGDKKVATLDQKITANPGWSVPPLSGGSSGSVNPMNASGSAANKSNEQIEQQMAQLAQQKLQREQQAYSSGLSAANIQQQSNAAQAQQNAAIRSGMAPNGNAIGQSQPDDAVKKEGWASKQTSGNVEYSMEYKKKPNSRYEIKAGSVIPAVLLSAVNSELPGQLMAQVRQDVYDSAFGDQILIPKGAKLLGVYDSNVSYGQKRLQIAWTRIIYNDGSSFNLKGMPGSDAAGRGGLGDQVDNHYTRIFGSAIMMSLVSAGVQLSQPQQAANAGQSPNASQVAGAALGQQLGQVSTQMMQKNLQVAPTIEIRPGFTFNINVTADLIIPPDRS